MGWGLTGLHPCEFIPDYGGDLVPVELFGPGSFGRRWSIVRGFLVTVLLLALASEPGGELGLPIANLGTDLFTDKFYQLVLFRTWWYACHLVF